MSNAPRLVEQLAGLTAIRDIELLEFICSFRSEGHRIPRRTALCFITSAHFEDARILREGRQ